MPRKSPRIKPPSYRLHKRSGQAVATFDGKDFYFGRFGTDESQEDYRRLCAEWLSNGGRLPTKPDDLTVVELVARYVKFAAGYYRKPDGTPTFTIWNVKDAAKSLKRLYGRVSVNAFGPAELKVIRQTLIDADLARKTVNDRINAIRRIFRWGVAEGLVHPNVIHGLGAVTPLKRGRSEAKETPPVRPVPDAHVDAVKPHVPRQVWAMIEIQRLTGMRSGEVVIMRGRDLDMTGNLWTYTPSTHKTAHHGHEKVIYLGPQAQEVIRPFLRSDLSRYLFSPADAQEERYAKMRTARKSKVQPSQRCRKKESPQRTPGERYTPQSYGYCIKRACLKNNIPHWHPHQLRHAAATRLRKEFGLEIARCVLGQRSAAVTELYAELDQSKARDAMARIG